ncbi:hypothetical protein [Crocinitomix algicola]|uniref:hypothetical protein n=1 Tax=Crocinitomix algicola TaxID=1740263 RepID=UPI0008732787|nr:hypothetical protein [Crocinitomix algicola]
MKNSLFYLVFAVALMSCKKEAVEVEESGCEIPSTFGLADTPGSYWVYDWYEIDNFDNETSLHIRDSIYVVGDTIINDNIYTFYSGTHMGVPTKRFVRDSSGYIVNSTGFILYSTTTDNDTTHFFENVGSNSKTYWISKKATESVITPSGVYEVFGREGHFYKTNGTPFTNCDSVWVQQNFYDEKSGFEVLSQTAIISQLQNDCIFREKRLVVQYTP